jgi:polysaccharide biosynthesis transport protein
MSISPSLNANPSTEKRWEPETLLWIAWQRKGFVVLGCLLGLAVGAVLGFVLPRTYQSTAQISITKKRPDTVSEENVSPPQELLKSSTIIEAAIKSKGLGSLTTIQRTNETLDESIKNALIVTPGKTAVPGPSSVFKLSFRAGDADESQVVLAAVLDSFKDHMDKKHRTISKDTFDQILHKMEELEKEKAKKDAEYLVFRQEAPLLGKGKDGMELRQERLNSIQTKRSAILLQRIELEGQLTALEAAQKEGKSPDAILAMLLEFNRKNEGAEVGRERQVNLQEQLFPLLIEERKLVQIHGTNHPEVAAIRNRIEVARRLLVLPASAWKGECDVTKPGVDPVMLHLQLLTQKLTHSKISEDLLVKIFQTEQDEARRLAVYEIQNESYQTSLAMNQKKYEKLLNQLSDVGLIRDVGGYQIELIEPASLGKRVAPSMTLTLLLGAVIGLGLGLTSAYWTDFRDARFRTQNEVARSLGLNVLGAIPQSQTLRHNPITNGGSIEAEAFWNLRNTLCLLAEKAGTKVIDIAAPSRGEGTSTVATNLSVALAQTGKKVLLVDAHTSDVAAAAKINDSAVAGLSVVSASPAGFKEFVADVRDRFDFVIIDSPALLATADASAMVQNADAALLTIDFTRTTRPEAERAVQLLTSAGVKVLGVVINAAKE